MERHTPEHLFTCLFAPEDASNCTDANFREQSDGTTGGRTIVLLLNMQSYLFAVKRNVRNFRVDLSAWKSFFFYSRRLIGSALGRKNMFRVWNRVKWVPPNRFVKTCPR